MELGNPPAVKKEVRGLGYTPGEASALFDVVEVILPLTTDDWNEVTRRHVAVYPDKKRTAHSLESKVKKTAALKLAPTDNSESGKLIERARHLIQLIKKRRAGDMTTAMVLDKIPNEIRDDDTSREGERAMAAQIGAGIPAVAAGSAMVNGRPLYILPVAPPPTPDRKSPPDSEVRKAFLEAEKKMKFMLDNSMKREKELRDRLDKEAAHHKTEIQRMQEEWRKEREEWEKERQSMFKMML